MNWQSISVRAAWAIVLFLPSLLFAEEPLRLNLEGAINRAIEFNRQHHGVADGIGSAEYSLTAAEGDFELRIVPHAKAGLVGGGSAGSNPSFGGGVTLSKKFSRGTSVSITPSVYRTKGVFRNSREELIDGSHYDTNLNTVISQPLLRGLKKEYNLRGVRQAEYGLREARRRYHQATEQLVVQTVSQVYQVVRREATLRLQRDSYERLKNVVQAAEVKVKIGLADSGDVYRAEMEHKSAQEALLSAELAYEEAIERLKEILAVPLDSPLEIEAPLNWEGLEIDPNEAVALAMENRSEIDQMIDRIRNSRRNSFIAREELRPELNMVVNYSSHSYDQVFFRTFTHLNTNSWGIGFTSSTELSPDAKEASYQQSLITMRGAERALDIRRDQIAIEVKGALRQLDRLSHRIGIEKEKLEKAEGNLRFSQTKFDKGLANNFDVIQAEKALHQAGVNVIGAVTDYIVGTYRLRQALGTLVNRPEVW